MSHESFDTLFKAFGLVGGTVAFVVALWQYRDTKRKEFYATFWNRRLELYIQVAQAASTVATLPSLESAQDARHRFWMLFFGPMSLVEDAAVKEAMQLFGTALSAAERGERPLVSLQQPAYRLALALRESLRLSWERPFVFAPPPPAPDVE